MRLTLSSDFFNPMLVRDLRQGLRSRLFTLVFLLLQGGMAFFVVLGIMSTIRSDLMDLINGTLWVGLVGFYYVGLPLAATFALAPEFRENRLDLLKLTQMSARSLVWGKWCSLVLQGLLVASSLLPYLALRYFLGGIEVTQELETLGLIIGGSALLTAVCLAACCINSTMLRVVTIILLFWIVPGVGFGSYAAISAGAMFGLPTLGMGSVALAFLFCSLPVLFFFLEFGAYRLAPAAENHDTPQRLVLLALAVVLAVALGIFTAYSSSMMLRAFVSLFAVLTFIQAMWVFVFAAGSDPSPYPDTYRPFVRLGAPGRLAGRLFLYPGWPSSGPFILLMTVFFGLVFVTMNYVMSGVVTTEKILHDPQFWSFWFLLPPALLFPQVAARAAGAGWRTRLGFGARYLLVFGICVIVLIVCTILGGVSEKAYFQVFSCLLPPNACFLLTANNGSMIDAEHLPLARLVAGLVSVPTLLFALYRAARYWPKFDALEKRAAVAIAGEKSPAPKV